MSDRLRPTNPPTSLQTGRPQAQTPTNQLTDRPPSQSTNQLTHQPTINLHLWMAWGPTICRLVCIKIHFVSGAGNFHNCMLCLSVLLSFFISLLLSFLLYIHFFLCSFLLVFFHFRTCLLLSFSLSPFFTIFIFLHAHCFISFHSLFSFSCMPISLSLFFLSFLPRLCRWPNKRTYYISP